MKTNKLSFEDFKENRLERKQIATILGGDRTPAPLGEYVDPNDIGPHEGGTGGTDNGAGTVNPKP